MSFENMMISSFLYNYPFNKSVGVNYLKEQLERVIFGGESLNPDYVKILGSRKANESDKTYAIRMYNTLN